MKKLIILSILLMYINTQAQGFRRHSVELGVGQSIYSDRLGNAKLGLLLNGGYRYMLTPTFGVQGFAQVDDIKSLPNLSHPDCEYSAISNTLRVEAFKRIARFGRFIVNGTAGFGVTHYQTRIDHAPTVFNYTAAGNIMHSLGNKKNPWGAIKLEYRGIANTGQDRTLNNNFNTTSNPIQAFKQDLLGGIVFYLGKNKKDVHADWYKKKVETKVINNRFIEQPVNLYPTQIINNRIIVLYRKFVVFFQEGKYDIQDHQKDDIYEAVEFLKGNPQFKAVVLGGACTNQGSDARNLELSQKRALAVWSKMYKMGIPSTRIDHKGTGVGNGYGGNNSDIQKRVDIIIYK